MAIASQVYDHLVGSDNPARGSGLGVLDALERACIATRGPDTY